MDHISKNLGMGPSHGLGLFPFSLIRSGLVFFRASGGGSFNGNERLFRIQVGPMESGELHEFLEKRE